jgi:hypothetical protein
VDVLKLSILTYFTWVTGLEGVVTSSLDALMEGLENGGLTLEQGESLDLSFRESGIEAYHSNESMDIILIQVVSRY